MYKLLFILLFASSAIPATAEPLTGLIVGVTDGDTIKLLTPKKIVHKIRLSGIDAPENSQPFGTKSKQSLSACAYNQTATVDTYKEDRYGRLVGKVLVNGVDCNLMQIEFGLAWHYKKYENEQELEDRSRYAQAEYLAKKEKRGLWAETNAIAPWDWRKLKRPN